MIPFQSIMITGGAGFIGAHFIHHLIKAFPDITIINYDKLTYAANLNNLKTISNLSNYIFVQGDICDEDYVSKVIAKYQVDTIVHFAAESHVDRSIADGSVFVQTNVLGTNTLLQAFLRAKHPVNRFHHVSTDEVYGDLDINEAPFTEKHPYLPSSPYSASKASSDLLVKSYHRTYGLPCTISNCSNNYGAFQHAEKMIPKVIKCCIEQQPIPVYGNGQNIRDWIYVDDHCKAIEAILVDAKAGEQYNIGGEQELSNIQLIEEICSIFDTVKPKPEPYSKLITFVDDRLGHDFRYAIDNTLINQRLGWAPKSNIKDELNKLISKKGY